MSVITVYILEDDKKTCDEYINHSKNFKTIKFVGSSSDSRQALKDIKRIKPDALILDLELQDGYGDGTELLIKLSKIRNYRRPFILVCTNNISFSTQKLIRKHGADYILSKQQKGFSTNFPLYFLDMLSSTIYDSMHPTDVPDIIDISDATKIQLIQQELYNLGINPKHKGYNYLAEGIFLSLTTKHQTMTDVCTAIALKYGKKIPTIEQSMQNAIKSCWTHNDPDVLLEKYTAIIDIERTSPTLKEFLEFYTNKFKSHEYFTN